MSSSAAEGVLPEVAGVPWRQRVDERHLRRTERFWTAVTTAHVIPFVGTAAVLVAVEPFLAPVAALCVAKAWIIPGLYARRGANVARRLKRTGEGAERTALGLLGDLVGHAERDLHARTGLVLERGAMGVWLVGEAGAVLVRPGGKRVHCYCVRVPDPDLPSSDRIAHLLLALRADEAGFVTVANLAFAGAPWRLRRRLASVARPALDAARAAAREMDPVE